MNNTVLKIEEFTDLSSNLDLTLGINPVIFRDAMQSGISLYKSVNKFHPVTAGGSRAWEEIVATFRSQVIEQNEGWQAVQQNGMPVLINSTLGITIVMTSGDENTGLINSIAPKTKNAKGQSTESYVGQNYDLFDNTANVEEPVTSAVDSHQTWVLLYTLDKAKSEVRYELSLPTNTAISGNKGKIKICDWQTRVMFPAISFNEIVIPEPNTDFTDDSDFFNVEKK
ncbi:hypothetical protein ABF107_003723 [Vibrio parahaemolyticus]